MAKTHFTGRGQGKELSFYSKNYLPTIFKSHVYPTKKKRIQSHFPVYFTFFGSKCLINKVVTNYRTNATGKEFCKRLVNPTALTVHMLSILLKCEQ